MSIIKVYLMKAYCKQWRFYVCSNTPTAIITLLSQFKPSRSVNDMKIPIYKQVLMSQQSAMWTTHTTIVITDKLDN